MKAAALSDALRRSDAAWVIAMNAVPVFGVVTLGWQALPLLAFYWIENLAIGLVNVAKIASAGLANTPRRPQATVLTSAFFLAHYGAFCLIHGAVLLAMFTAAAVAEGMKGGLHPFDLWAALFGSELAVGGALILLLRVGEFFAIWLRCRAWQGVDPGAQAFEPYGRLIVMHLALIIAVFPILWLGQPVVAILGLALLKCGLELGLPQFRVLIMGARGR